MKAFVDDTSLDKTTLRIPLSNRKHILVIVHRHRGLPKNSLEGPVIVNSNAIIRRNGDIRVNMDKCVIKELMLLAKRLAKAQVSLLPVVSEARRLLCIR
jgi:hypothetical protein